MLRNLPPKIRLLNGRCTRGITMTVEEENKQLCGAAREVLDIFNQGDTSLKQVKAQTHKIVRSTWQPAQC